MDVVVELNLMHESGSRRGRALQEAVAGIGSPGVKPELVATTYYSCQL